MSRIDRGAYAQMFGPTTGDRVRLADTALVIEVEEDRTLYGEEVKFGGGKVIRDGMGQSQRASGEARGHRHHQRPHPRPLGHRQGGRGHQGRPHRGHRQGGQPRRAAGRGPRHRSGHRGDRRRRTDPHRGRARRAHPLHLPAAGGGSAGLGDHHDDRRRHRAGGGHRGHHLHPGALEHRAHVAGLRGVADELRPAGQGQRQPSRCAARAGAGRRDGPEAARGLGDHPGRHRLLPEGGRCRGPPGLHPYRYAERIGLRRTDPRRHRRAGDPHLPHRGRRGRPRAGHHPRLRRGQRPSFEHQPDPPRTP